jgi:hypothetical protein
VTAKVKRRVRTPAPARAATAKKASAAVQREVAETRRRARSGESAKATDRLISEGHHPLAACQT